MQYLEQMQVVAMAGSGACTSTMSDDDKSISYQSKAGSGGLKGLTKDVKNVVKHFGDGGAHVEWVYDEMWVSKGKELRSDALLGCLRTFLEKKPTCCVEVSNKLIYYTGHGSESGHVSIGNNKGGFNLDDIVDILTDIKYAGVLTIVIDSCFAGSWARNMRQRIRNSRLHEHLKGTSTPFRLNLRMSSGKGQKSKDTQNGGVYTNAWLAKLDDEARYLAACGDYPRIRDTSSPGWGNQCNELNQEVTSLGTDQTDVNIDFCWHNPAHDDQGTWLWYYESDRESLWQ